jgi:hypothetical protein
MKALLKPIFTGFFSLFNVGIYLSDGVDSLIQKLNFLGLENQANEIVRLYELIEFQTQVILMLDALRTFLMLLSLLFLLVINYQLFKRCFFWFKNRSQRIYFFLKTKLKTFFRKWLM